MRSGQNLQQVFQWKCAGEHILAFSFQSSKYSSSKLCQQIITWSPSVYIGWYHFNLYDNRIVSQSRTQDYRRTCPWAARSLSVNAVHTCVDNLCRSFDQRMTRPALWWTWDQSPTTWGSRPGCRPDCWRIPGRRAARGGSRARPTTWGEAWARWGWEASTIYCQVWNYEGRKRAFLDCGPATVTRTRPTTWGEARTRCGWPGSTF